MCSNNLLNPTHAMEKTILSPVHSETLLTQNIIARILHNFRRVNLQTWNSIHPLSSKFPHLPPLGGWVGRWCWVASSARASYYFGIWQGRGLLCLQQERDGWAVFWCVFSSRLSYLHFLMPHLLGDGWTYWNNCGLGRYYPTVVVSYYQRACSLNND